MLTAGGIKLGSCTGLEDLILHLAPEFSMSKHAGFVKELLTSWTPQHSEPRLVFHPRYESQFTRQSFADVLRGVGMIAEEWLQTVKKQPSEGGSGTDNRVECKLEVAIYDWDAQKEWWDDHVKGCFPTWLKLKRLAWSLKTRKCPFNSVLIAADLTFRTAPDKGRQWMTEKSPSPADTTTQSAIEPNVGAESSSSSKVAQA